MYCTLVAVVLLVPPSPKVHARLVIEPTEPSENVTVNGAVPLVGLPVKLAVGGTFGPTFVRPHVIHSRGWTRLVLWPAPSDATVLEIPIMSTRFNTFTVTV